MSIVEKSVTQIPTSKGLNQAADALLTGDSPLVVQNLVQDRAGRWSKRPGLQEYGYSTQDGEIIYNPRFCFGTRSGLALVANKLSDGALAGRFVVTMDATNGLAQFRGRFPEFCAKQTPYGGAPFAVTSGATEYSLVSPRIIGAKRFGNYVGTVQTTSGGAVRVDVADARTGQSVRSYAINAAAPLSVAVAVTGTYLHVYIAAIATGTFSVFCYEFYALALPTEAAGPSVVSVFSVATAGSSTSISACDGSATTWATFTDGTAHRVAVVNQGATLGGVYNPAFAYNGAIATDGTYGYVLSATSLRQVSTAGVLVSSMTLTLGGMTSPSPERIAVSPAGDVLIYARDTVGNTRHLMSVFTYAGAGSVGPLARAVWDKSRGTCRALAWLPSMGKFYALLDQGMFGGFTTPLPVPLTNAEWYAGGGTGRAWVMDASSPIPVVVSGSATFGGRSGQLRTVATLENSLVCGALGLDVDTAGSLYATHVQAPSQNSSVAIVTSLLTDLATATCINGNWGSVITGAAPCSYDGSRAGDVQFPQPPLITTIGSGAGTLAAGTYSYVAVYRFTDAQGRVLRSETSDIVTINRTTAAQYSITVQPPLVLSRSDSQNQLGTETVTFDRLAIELYRTTNNGKVFYLVNSTPATGATWTFITGTNSNGIGAAGLFTCVFSDATSDLELATRQKCYRNPGVAGTSLQHEPAPASVHGCVHKDRLFLAHADGNRIFSSSFAVDGEGAWFSPAFQVQVPGGQGRVVALASMDNRLVVLRERGVFVVDGDGPPENGGNGSEFSPPQQVSSLGCTDSQSVVTTDAGVYFRSHRGLELLTRKLSVEPIGDAVLDFTDAYPVVKWSLYDQENDRVMFCLTDYRTYTGDSGTTATVLCWDQSYKCWSELRYFSYGRGVANGAIHAPEYACSAQLDIYGNSNKYSLFGVDYQYYICQFVSQLGTDFASYVPTKWQGAWRFNGGPDGRQRIYDWQVIGKSSTPCTVTLSLDYDFSDASPQTRTFTDTEVTAVPGSNSEARRLVIQPNNQASESMRLTIQDTAPTVGAAGTGRGWSFYGIALEGGPKAGVTKIAKEGKS